MKERPGPLGYASRFAFGFFRAFGSGFACFVNGFGLSGVAALQFTDSQGGKGSVIPCPLV